ncbi:bile acid:sodium symporter family protein [Aliikangiella coralliicola]|uniref:bile acid:sodium symporter family protein n=1 Tax=Aliikangiella coralliicola TaxID=2592383 RepID=UPI001AEF45A5|nr:bile acid:sodium symporter family protein [Aliikangiella coralliicola]
MTRFFAVWVILISVIAYWQPGLFLGIKPLVALLLGVIMFGMGMTLKFEDFKSALLQPVPIVVGVLLQFGVMPALGFGLALLLELPPEIAAGVVLVGACPGGTASNVMVYLARGNVALSIAMTAVSTVLAPLVTPFLVLFYAQQWLPIDAGSLFLSIVKIVLVPVLLGLLFKRFFPQLASQGEKWSPSISVLAIVAIIAFVVAANVDNILTMSVLILVAVILHNLLGLLSGYFISLLLRQGSEECRAIALEVGMQNSGLGAVLAQAHFSPAAAIPSAIFSVWHNISGSIFASIWSRNTTQGKQNE